jgi:hypothetical protein
MSAGTATPRAKGLAFRGMLGSLKRLKGDEGFRKLLDLLPPELARTAKADLFVTQTWYPLGDYLHLLHAIAQLGGGDLALVQALSREATLNDFRGVYRILTFVMSPQFLMKRGPALFNRYFDTGTLVVEAEPHRGVARYHGCAGFNHLLWNDVMYGGSAVLEACGAKDQKFKMIEGGKDGDDFCTVQFTWR